MIRLVIVFLLSVACLRAAGSGRDQAYETKLFEALTQSAGPEIAAAFRTGTEALDKRDFTRSIADFTRVLQAQPKHDPSLRRRAAAWLGAGDRTKAFADNQAALAIDRNAYNLLSYASNLIDDAGSITERKGQFKQALELLRAAEHQPDGASLTLWAMRAYCALRLDLLSELSLCTAKLLETYPNEAVSHYYAAILAATNQEWLKAEDEVENARALGLSAKQADDLLAAGITSNARPWRWALWTGEGALLWLGGMALLFGAGWWLSALTLRHAESGRASREASMGERRVRNWYRWVVNSAGTYYYISLPLVTVAVIALAAGVGFFTLAAGFIALKLLLIFGVAAFATVAALVRTIFLKPTLVEEGRVLTKEEAPGLFQLVEEVAQKMKTRPVAEIRLLPGTELAVYERGTRREKKQDRATRVLLLGTGVLEGFPLQAFEAVLAHEYGHFSNRDTAGGEIALRVMRDMRIFYFSMVNEGVATWYNLGFHFLRLYHFVFQRITAGATRLQEILADRVAAHLFGAPAFETGLTHVVRRSIEFDLAMGREVKEAIEGRRALQNVYVDVKVEAADLETKFKQAMERPTTLDDTHPSPRDRFRLIEGVVGSEPTRDGEVWSLFADPQKLKAEMVAELEKWVAPHRKSGDFL